MDGCLLGRHFFYPVYFFIGGPFEGPFGGFHILSTPVHVYILAYTCYTLQVKICFQIHVLQYIRLSFYSI